MLLNYLRIAFRNIKNNPGYTFINILGLSVGLSVAIMIFLYVQDELNFDKVHPVADETYRIGIIIKNEDGSVNYETQAPSGWDQYLKEKYDGVIEGTGIWWTGMPYSMHNKETDNIILTEELYWVKEGFPQVFHFPLIQGNKETALEGRNQMVISESAARKLFGDEDPISKSISITHSYIGDGKTIDVVISGVMEDYPAGSHIRPMYLLNIRTLAPYYENWEESLQALMPPQSQFYNSYITIKEGTDFEQIEEDLQEIINDALQRMDATVEVTPFFRKITDIHFDKEVQWTTEGSADIKYIYVFVSVAFLILIVACINYTNLATARSMKRAKEVGLRKAMGSNKTELFFQFITESLIMVLMAAIIAFLIVMLALPYFNELSQKIFRLESLLNPDMLLLILAVVLFVTFTAGAYPAFYLASFEPAVVLKGKFRFGKGSNRFRTLLTVMQFTVSIILVLTTVIIVRQMNLMQKSKLNEAGEQIVSIRYGGTAPDNKYQTFKNSAEQISSVSSVSIGNHLPRLDYFGPVGMVYSFPEINDERHEWNQLNGDYDFPTAFSLELIAGRFFQDGNLADSSTFVINESAARALQKTPEEMVGMEVSVPGGNSYQGFDFEKFSTARVIGVVKDFPYKSMHYEIEPLLISPRPHFIDKIVYVKLDPHNMDESIQALQSTWKEIFPGIGFDYWFLDHEFERMYRTETKIAGLATNFAGIAFLITCFGLLGLASFMSEQRTKEIGIRKTLGGTTTQMVILLLTSFFKIILMACLVAIPVTIFLSLEWLQTFVYQAELSVWLFVITILLISILTILIVGYETLKTSFRNPVSSLKYE